MAEGVLAGLGWFVMFVSDCDEMVVQGVRDGSWVCVCFAFVSQCCG